MEGNLLIPIKVTNIHEHFNDPAVLCSYISNCIYGTQLSDPNILSWRFFKEIKHALLIVTLNSCNVSILFYTWTHTCKQYWTVFYVFLKFFVNEIVLCVPSACWSLCSSEVSLHCWLAWVPGGPSSWLMRGITAPQYPVPWRWAFGHD